MMASGSAIRAPAPIPWNARKAASIIIDVEKAESVDPRMKTMIPRMKSGRRPKMSLSLP